MVYDEDLVQRIRQRLDLLPGYSERRMFGGIAFLLLPHCRPFDFTGRAMRGWGMVAPEATMEETGLSAWIDRGVTFAFSLPAKGGEG